MLPDSVSHRSLSLPREVARDAETRFETALTDLLEQHPGEITLDCSGVDYITSPHVKLLWRTRQRCDHVGIAMHVKSASSDVRRVLEELDLKDLFDLQEESSSTTADIGRSPSHDSAPDGYEEEFRATARDIGEALGRFLEFMRHRAVPRPIEYVLRTIFYEATTNIRLHAGLGEGDRIAFSVSSARAGMIMIFRDRGAPFDFTAYRPEARDDTGPDERRSFGIIMIRKLADRVYYERENGTHNVLVVERKWGKDHA